ncbi:hypothetical protein HRH25_21745 [Flavisolibacter sp. BT320]|nr:hypothetical protein [Flavisolibacter longurius]
MRNKILYIIDNFCPRALYDQTIINNDTFYVIVNTFIINTDDFDECPLITDYLNPATQAASYTWEYLGANARAMQIAGEDPSRLVPVPPPLNVPLIFSFNGMTVDNKLGFEFLSEEEKVDWIRQSNSSIVVNLSKRKTGINYFDYVLYGQLVTLNKWFTALLTDVFRKEPGEITDALEKKIWNCDWTGENPAQFRESFVSKIENQQATIPASKKLPLGIQNFYIASYCHFLSIEGIDITSSFAPDPLKFSKEAFDYLKTRPAEAKAELGADKNYRRVLCQNIASEKEPAKLVERLQFFYGAGERVRINRDAGISLMAIKDIDTPDGMQLNPDGTQSGWMETNAYSLCGQVAAIPMHQVQLPSFATTFTITAGTMSLLAMLSAGDRKNYFDSITAYIHNTNHNDHSKFKRSLSFPATYVVDTTTLNQEKANYYPVNALLDHNFTPYPIQLGQDSFATVIKLPEALLDTLVDYPRVTYQGDDEDAAFIKLNPQRMLLREEDLFKKDGTNEVKFIPMENSIELKNFTPALVVSVQVKKVVLPEQQKQVFKISKKASVPLATTDPQAKDVVTELQELRKLLYGPGDSLRKDDFVFRIVKVQPAANIILINVWTDGKVDDDEMIEIYAEGLSPMFNQGNSQGVKDTVDADLLIIPVQNNIPNMFQRGFNVLLHKESSKTAFIALDKHYNFRFNISVNGFSRAMEVTLDKNGFVNAGQGSIEPLLFDYSNFNKFRISLKNGEELKLNTNDALLPLSEHGSSEMPQNFHYRTTHRFAEEVNSQSNDANQENRYKLYRLNVNPLSLRAKIENQYAFRLAVELGGLTFPYSHPIRNLGDLKTTEVTGDLVSTFPLLTFTLSDTNEKLILTLNKKYLQKLLRNQQDQGAAHITVYRALYEAFFDALHNRCQLTLELWNFNNSLHGLNPEEAAHPEISREWPSLMKHLEKRKTEVLLLDFTDLLKSFNKTTFKEFKEAINAYIDGSATHTKTVTLTSSLATEIGNTNIVRLGLLITRTDDKTVRQQFKGGVPNVEDLRPFPLKGEDELGSTFAFTRTEVARAALQSYIDSASGNNTLFTSFSYVSSEWYDINKPTDTSADQRTNVKELLGETTSFIWRPKGLAPNMTDMLLYYVTYSFRPLQVHPKLLDLKTTISFAEYLLRLLAWLAYPEKQKEDPKTFLVDIVETNNAETLFKTKLQARDRILPSIAEKLVTLLTYVDNRPQTFTNPHYELVSVISERIKNSLSRAFRSMLMEDPVKYITAKGFGVGLFSGVSTKHLESHSVLPPDGEMRDLYMLQLIKDIRRPLAPGAPSQAPKANDVTRVNFKAFLENTSESGPVSDRFFIETLEDALYDNEFQISEKGNAQSEPFDASQVRTAEDMLENNNRLNEQKASDKPGKFAVAHYCPDWISQQNEKFYLLPSRTPPSTPVPYTPAQIKLTKNSEADWDKLVLKLSDDISLAFSPTAPPVIFESRGVAHNEKLHEIKSKFWDRWDIFINTYDFIIEPDEEGEIKNDLFELYVSDKIDTSSLDQANLADTLDIPNTDIFKQFEFYVRKKEGAVKPLELHALMPLDGTTGVIQNLLDELLKPGSEDPTGTISDIRLRHDNSGKFILTINSSFALRERVLSAEVFRVKAAPATQPVKHVIRIKILADPWSHFRCRLRVRRNMRDIANDGRFDINPAFVINSAFSTWIDYGIQSLSYNYLSDVQGSAEWPIALKYLEPSTLSYAEYRAKITSNKPIPFGDLLLQHLAKNKKMFAVDELQRKERLFNSYVEQRVRSAAPQLFHRDKDLSSIITYKKLATDSLAKSGVAKITADTLVHFDVAPETIRSHEPILHFTWYSTEDSTKEVFSISLKLKLKKSKNITMRMK